MQVKKNQLLLGGIPAVRLAERFGSPLYVYEEETVRARARELRRAITYPDAELLYSCKANSNLALLRLLRQEGCGIDAVSPGEIFLALRAGFRPAQILFSGNNASDDELRYVLASGVRINLDSVVQVDRLGALAPAGTPVSVRVNPDVGEGHHDHVITGGPHSKFGVWIDQLDELRRVARRRGLRIVGLHQHIGSGILEAETFLVAMEVLLELAAGFPELEMLDFGGGLGVPYAPTQRSLGVTQLGAAISRRFARFVGHRGRRLRLLLEPGRYFVAEAGTLLCRVTSVKQTPEHVFVGTDSGLNHLIRHALYGAHHEIRNASRVRGASEFVAIAGNICESGDLFTHGREVTRFRVGDVVAILTAGAYGYAMSSQYNSRPRPAEVMVRGGRARLIRRRESFEDLLRTQV